MVRLGVAGVFSVAFWASGLGVSRGHSGAAVLLAGDVLLSVWSAFRVGDGGLLAWACSASSSVAVTSPPPVSGGWLRESTLTEPSNDWTVARTPLSSRL